MKNAFYFMLKAFFVLDIFTFLPWFFVYAENNLIRKLRLISKFMTSKPGQQIVTINILSNISRGEDNQTINLVS